MSAGRATALAVTLLGVFAQRVALADGGPSDDRIGVSVDGSTRGYCRADRDEPNAEVHFCAECGSTSHFVLTKGAISKFGNTLMGVNMWLANERDLRGVEVRYPDGQAWSGSGGFTYVREPRVIG